VSDTAVIAHGWSDRLSRLSDRLREIAGSLGHDEAHGDAAQPAEARHPWEAAYPADVDWRIALAPGTMTALFDRAVETYADQTCLEFFGKRQSYRETGALVARAAKGLAELGVGKGVRVGLFLPNCPYYVICYHAVLKAGGTVVNFNPLYAEKGIARQIRDADVRIMVTMNLGTLYPKIEGRLSDTGLERIVVCSMSAALPFPGNAFFALFKRRETSAYPADERHLKFEKLIANDGDFAAPEIAPDDIALLQYTGGTTGTPKGAMLSHANLHANTLQTRSWAPGIIDGEEKFLAVLPLFHVFGMTGVMNVGLNIGAEIQLLPRFKVAEVLKAVDKSRPTVLMGVPTMFSALNGSPETEKFDLSSLKFCISGGAPLPLEVKTTFEKIAGCTLVEGYGLTEAAPVCTINPIGAHNKPGSAGLPIPGTVIEIVSLDDPHLLLPPGEKGEICVTGPQVMQGYWMQEEESETALEDGRLHTGDVGHIDEDGHVFISDRIKDLIITGGFNVYPRMVEEAVQRHPAVDDVAVCGVPSSHHGEIVKAFVVLRPGEKIKAADLRAFLKDRLASFEMPRRIQFIKVIPKNMLGKPLRRELVAREWKKAGLERASEPGEEGETS
jgi:long-chain acyl-CoA synthetase